ncbi:hypothetical protein N0V88_002193 [Collariella sp. IMI 366227]|nr:hypothetical protein N0V88_002193 [Collariella sp. IMI 366227]
MKLTMNNLPYPVPVVTFGKDPKMAKNVIDKLLPDIEGLGTNAHTTDPAKRRRTPAAVFFGGSFTDKEYNAIVSCVEEAVEKAGGKGKDSVKFVKCGKLDVLKSGGPFTPLPEAIAGTMESGRDEVEEAVVEDEERRSVGTGGNDELPQTANKRGSWIQEKCKSGWRRLSSGSSSGAEERAQLSAAELQVLRKKIARRKRKRKELWELFCYSLSGMANIHGPVGDIRLWNESYFR